ncbi:DedA family protein [Actinomycetospora sp. CA-101289]|uniref:DedA family protein n=1 Tax=Actinomycetospora sp. CA-101289 TaxID=3239893 RepID=UPI003D97F383
MSLLDASWWIALLGVAAVPLVLFVETGLLVGFFLPGDSLLFTAGVLTATAVGSPAHLPLAAVLVGAPLGAVLGAQCGWWIGRRAGPALRSRDRSPRVRGAMDRADGFLRRYGYGKAIVLARFVPVVRTVINPVAGALRVPTATFTLWQIVGGVVWAVGLTLAGHLLGASIPGVDQYLLPIIAVIVVVSLVPVVVELVRGHRRVGRGS